MKNKTVKRIIKILLLVVIFALVAAPAVYVNAIYGYLPVIALVLAVLISVVCLLIVRRSVRISSDFADTHCQRGKSVEIGLRIANGAIILAPRAEANIFVTDIFGGNDSQTRTTLTLAPRTDNHLAFDMDMPHIGVYDVGIDDMEIFDFFGIFSSHVKIDGRYQVYVMPRIFPVDELVNTEMIKDEAPKDRSTAVVGGTDYMGTREYVVGDSMKNIHWKLSSKMASGYMTKIFESTREMEFSVILDFTADKLSSRESAMDIYDTLVETALSLIEEIARTHTSYYLIYPDKQNNIKRTTPRGRGDDLTLIKDFPVVTENPGPEVPDAYTILEEGNKNSNRSSNLLIVTCRVTEDLIQELANLKRGGLNPELYLVVPAGSTRKELDGVKEQLMTLDEAGVFFNFITAGMQEGTI